jgi:predicted nucleotidyltransferase
MLVVVASAALVDRIRAALVDDEAILEAYLFGSHARGTAAAHSDVDVAVYLGRSSLDESPFGPAAELTARLMRALGTNDVDVVVLNRAPPLLYHRVLRDGVRLFARDLAATTVREGRALSRWYDYVPQMQKIERAVVGSPGGAPE